MALSERRLHHSPAKTNANSAAAPAIHGQCQPLLLSTGTGTLETGAIEAGCAEGTGVAIGTAVAAGLLPAGRAMAVGEGAGAACRTGVALCLWLVVGAGTGLAL